MSDPTMVDAKVPDTGWMDDYDTGGSTFIAPPQAMEVTPSGRTKFIQYAVQAPSTDKIKLRDANNNWLTTKEGFLKAVIEGFKLVNSGYELREVHIGTAQYRKYDKNRQPTGELRHASPALDYFRAYGMDPRPSSREDYENSFQTTADRIAFCTIQWTAYDNDTKSSVAEKWESFPIVDLNNTDQKDTFARLYPGQDPTGKRLPFIERNGKRFWARAEVKRWISAIEEKA